MCRIDIHVSTLDRLLCIRGETLDVSLGISLSGRRLQASPCITSIQENKEFPKGVNNILVINSHKGNEGL